jgi:hypothetical protein
VTVEISGVPLCGRGADHDTVVDPACPADRTWHLDRQFRLVMTLGSGEPRAAQLPHHGDMIGELALNRAAGTSSSVRPARLRMSLLPSSAAPISVLARIGKPASCGVPQVLGGGLEGWDDHGLPCRQGCTFLAQPDLGTAVEHGRDFLHHVQRGGRTAPSVTPLLEDAKLLRAVQGRDAHARKHAGPPLLPALSRVIDHSHRALGQV